MPPMRAGLNQSCFIFSLSYDSLSGNRWSENDADKKRKKVPEVQVHLWKDIILEQEIQVSIKVHVILKQGI